jgi:hypothetical protein
MLEEEDGVPTNGLRTGAGDVAFGDGAAVGAFPVATGATTGTGEEDVGANPTFPVGTAVGAAWGALPVFPPA